MSAPRYEDVKTFFENNALSQQAAKSIKDGKEIALTIEGQDYTFTKKNGSNELLKVKAAKADVSFKVPAGSAQELVTKSFSSVGQVGLFIFEQIVSNDPSRKIEVKLHTGFLGLMGAGYLGVLTSGGAEVAKFLAAKGLGSLGKLKETISKLKA